MKKTFIYGLLLFAALYMVLILLAFQFEKRIYTNYGEVFNDIRISKGMFPLYSAKLIEKECWSTLSDTDNDVLWKWILTNQEIPTTVTYYFDTSDTKPYHVKKVIWYNTQLFFWQNYYAGEMDIFYNPISEDTTLKLVSVYYSENLEPANYFYTSIDTLYPHKPFQFKCGTFVVNDSTDISPKGNITKEELDKTLIQWDLKTPEQLD